MAHLVRPRSPEVVGRVVGVTHRAPEEPHPVEVRPDHSATVGQVRITEVAAGRVGVDVQVAGRVPADAGGVAPPVVVPVLVPVPRDPGGGAAVRIGRREVELNLGVRQGREVRVEDGDLLEDARVRNVPRPVVRVQHVKHNGDVVDVRRGARRVIARIGHRYRAGAVALGSKERHGRGHVQRIDTAALPIAQEEGRGEVLVPVREQVRAFDVIGEDGAILQLSDSVALDWRALIHLSDRRGYKQDGGEGANP